MNKKLAAIIFLLALIGAAYIAFFQVFTVAHNIEPEELRRAIVQHLDAEGIWYQEEPNGVVRVFKSNEQEIFKLGRSASEELIPMNRSFSPAPGLLEETEAKLRNRGIEYELRDIGGSTWIVLEKEYEGRVEEVWLNGI